MPSPVGVDHASSRRFLLSAVPSPSGGHMYVLILPIQWVIALAMNANDQTKVGPINVHNYSSKSRAAITHILSDRWPILTPANCW